MENIFFAPSSDFINQTSVELKDQEAQHVSKVLRYSIGDNLLVADGEGHRFNTEIVELNKRSVIAQILSKQSKDIPKEKKVLAMGVIKKRDRLEFAIEKAVELGAWEICLFNADHSERSKINYVRVASQIKSAFKQSGRFWLPKLTILDSIASVYDHYTDSEFVMAHEEIDIVNEPVKLVEGQNILLVGPEGGFSKREIDLHNEKGGAFISLGANRLRAETAVVTFLSQYIFSS